MKLTKNQTLVLDVLKREVRPLSAYAILDKLRPMGLQAPPQVYRALESLQAKGLVHRLESENAFVACEAGAPHQTLAAFAICAECGVATEFDADAVDAIVRTWAEHKGFHMDRTVLELKGVCAACAESAAKVHKSGPV